MAFTNGYALLVGVGNYQDSNLAAPSNSRWRIIGQTDRFKAAMTCRSVNDLTSQMMTGDIAGPAFGRLDMGAAPWEDPDLFRALSPITHARNIRTP